MVISVMRRRHSLVRPSILLVVLSLVSAGIIMALLLQNAYADSKLIVNRSNLQGWIVGGSDPLDVLADSAAPVGSGVLRFGSPKSGSQLTLTRLVPTTIYAKDLSAGYYTKRVAGNTYVAPGYTFTIDLDGNPATADRFTAMYEPVHNNPSGKNYNIWNKWEINPNSTFGFSGAVPPTVATPRTSLARAILGNEATATITRIQISQGSSGSLWQTHVDAIRFMDTTFDFEQEAGPQLTSPTDNVIMGKHSGNRLQSWEGVRGATKYRYQAFSTDPRSNQSAVPIVSRDIVDAYHTVDTQMSDGNYYWRVQTIEPFVSSWSSVGSFLVDTTDPTIGVPLFAQPLGGNGIVAAGTITELNLDTITIQVDGELVDQSAITVTGNGYTAILSNLAAGSHALVITATDKAGNTTTASYPFTVDDVIAPVIVLNQDGEITEGDEVVVTGMATDNHSSVANVEVMLDGVSKGTAAVAGGAFIFSLGALDEGTYTVTAKGADADGNEGMSQAVVVTVVHKTVPSIPETPKAVNPDPVDPAPQQGQSDLTTNPPGASVRVGMARTVALDLVDDPVEQTVELQESPIYKSGKSAVASAEGEREVKGAANDRYDVFGAVLGRTWVGWVVALVVASGWWLVATKRRRGRRE